MKIGFDNTPASPAGTYSRHLARLLAEHAPEHEYIVDGKRYKELDLYHGFRPGIPLPLLLRRIPCVMTVDNLNFLRYPHLYSFSERFGLMLYRRSLRSASRLIALNRNAREELSERLRIDPRKIEVVLPLAARLPQQPASEELESVRRKYDLPDEFILMLGTVEPRHNHEALFDALLELDDLDRERMERGEAARHIETNGISTAFRMSDPASDPLADVTAVHTPEGVSAATSTSSHPSYAASAEASTASDSSGIVPIGADATTSRRVPSTPVGIVVCGRRTAYADFLLGYARVRHMATRVDFIYELSPDDLPALFRLARAFVYLPDARIEASIVPVVEALRAGLPMILSDTPLNRETAGDAAVYVHPGVIDEVTAALENVLRDEELRREMQTREQRRAELFSEYAVARRLIDIYSSL